MFKWLIDLFKKDSTIKTNVGLKEDNLPGFVEAHENRIKADLYDPDPKNIGWQGLKPCVYSWCAFDPEFYKTRIEDARYCDDHEDQ